MTRALALAATLVVACGGSNDTSGPAPTAADASGEADTGLTTDGAAPATDAPSGATDGARDADAGAQADTAPDAPTSCVKQTYVLATSATDPECGFPLTLPPGYTEDQVNIVLTPGWGTVCFGYGCGAQGGWFWQNNGIALCDSTCAKYGDQPAGKLTVELGCPTVTCP